ncbi:hypothetical protein [Novosphingobium resinovorum]|uniref:hypothetical protein n=1 Tax=Novosphingobium resinovorum TaxID=158500 RepID=UPI002ED48806|nr:hypothetical protein [Novosphingobium resinovorum]
MADNSGWGLGNGNAQAVGALVSGTQQEYWFSLRLRVDSAAQLWQAAALRCLSQSDLSQDEVEDLIGPIEDPSIADCLMMLALPERLPGCTRLDTALHPVDHPGSPARAARETSDALDES